MEFRISVALLFLAAGSFASAAEQTPDRRKTPEYVDQQIKHISDADPVMRHEIRGWGSVTHQHGQIVDFTFDYGRSGKYGFHYWAWSTPVLTAYHAGGDPKYLAEFDNLFNAWYEQRDAVQVESE